MKKSFATLLIFCSTFHSFASYIRIPKNGGPNGYNYTKEKIDHNCNITIRCSGSGYEPCPVHIPKKPIEKELLAYAMSAIASGQLKGSYRKDGEKVTWVSDNVRMTNSKIKIR